tara:strand:- start:680 stop:1078 length:399 start_codon:yes stop_codon:yes gene_type:complete
MDIDMEIMDIPVFEYPCKMEMPCTELSKILKELRDFGDKIIVKIDQSSVSFSIDGGFSGGCLKLESGHGVQVTSNLECEASYSLKHLIVFCRASPLCDNVTTYISPDAPLKMSFVISDSDFIDFYLAPQVGE